MFSKGEWKYMCTCKVALDASLNAIALSSLHLTKENFFDGVTLCFRELDLLYCSDVNLKLLV